VLLAFLMAIGPMLTIAGCSKKDKKPAEQAEKSVEESEQEQAEDFEF